MIKQSVLFFAFIKLVILTANFSNTTSCSGVGCFFTQVRSQQNHWVTLTLNNNLGIIDYFQSGSYLQQSFSINPVDLPSLRTSKLNSNSNNRTFIQYTPSYVTLHNNFNNSLISSLDFSSFSSYFIYEGCIGQSLKQIYVLVNIYNVYNSILIFNGSTSYQTILNLTYSTTSDFDKMVYENGKIFLNFQNQIFIIAANSTLDLLNRISVPVGGSVDYADLQVRGQLLVYSAMNYLTLFNLTSNSTLFVYTHSSDLTCIQFYDLYYLVFLNTTHIFQYDLDLNQIVHSAPLQANLQMKVYYSSPNLLVIAKDFMVPPYTDTIIYYYTISMDYPCPNCLSCFNTYQIDVSRNLCVKIATMANVQQSAQNSSASQNNSVLQNYSVMQNTSALQNNSAGQNIPPLQNNSNLIQNYIASFSDQKDQLEYQIASYFEMLDNQTGIFSLRFISTGLLISSIKVSPQVLFSFCLFFDDLWFYGYHNNFLKKYPVSVQYFLKKIDIINIEKLDPWFIKIIIFIKKTEQVGFENNLKMRKYLNIQTIQGQDIFFTRSLYYNYTNNFILQIFLFILFKKLCKIFRSFRKKNQLALNTYNLLKRKSYWWIFCSSLIESYFAKIVFDFSIQIQFPNSFQYFDKINLIVCLSMFFIVSSYIFLEYTFIFSNLPKLEAKNFLVRLKYNRYSFIYEPVLFFGRPIIRSFLHGFFLKYYEIQIFLLLISDGIFLIINLKMKKLFHTNLIFCFQTVYLVLFGIFDLYFYLQYTTFIQQNYRRQLFGLIIVGSLIIVSLLIFLHYFYFLVIQFKDRLLTICIDSNQKTKNSKDFQKQINKQCAKIRVKNIRKQKKISKYESYRIRQIQLGNRTNRSNKKKQEIDKISIIINGQMIGKNKNHNTDRDEKQKAQKRISKIKNLYDKDYFKSRKIHSENYDNKIWSKQNEKEWNFEKKCTKRSNNKIKKQNCIKEKNLLVKSKFYDQQQDIQNRC